MRDPGYGYRSIWAMALFMGVALVASGCSTATSQAVLTNLQGCERHYDGTVSAAVVGGGNFTGSVKIDCHAVGATGTVVTAPAAATP